MYSLSTRNAKTPPSIKASPQEGTKEPWMLRYSPEWANPYILVEVAKGARTPEGDYVFDQAQMMMDRQHAETLRDRLTEALAAFDAKFTPPAPEPVILPCGCPEGQRLPGCSAIGEPYNDAAHKPAPTPQCICTSGDLISAECPAQYHLSTPVAYTAPQDHATAYAARLTAD